MKISSPNKIHFLAQPALVTQFLMLLLLALLAACNLPGNQTDSAQAINVTQAYETVAARLTQASNQQPPIPVTTEQPANTATPAQTNSTPTPQTTPAANAPTASRTPDEQKRCDQASPGYPSIDLTIEDDTQLDPGQAFTKIWRLVNSGTCTWTNEYALIWFSGDPMGALQVVGLNTRVEPGQTIDLSVDMIAPQANGTYQSNWKLRNAQGQYFGIGPDGESAFWVRVVIASTAAITPTSTLTPGPTAVVQASGPVTLVISDTLDLDMLQINTSGADLSYQKVATGEQSFTYQLLMLGNTQTSLFGSNPPNLADCQAAALSATPITIETLTHGSYLCYRTNAGLPGWLRLDAFSPTDEQLSLTILTWSIP